MQFDIISTSRLFTTRSSTVYTNMFPLTFKPAFHHLWLSAQLGLVMHNINTLNRDLTLHSKCTSPSLRTGSSPSPFVGTWLKSDCCNNKRNLNAGLDLAKYRLQPLPIFYRFQLCVLVLYLGRVTRVHVQKHSRMCKIK